MAKKRTWQDWYRQDPDAAMAYVFSLLLKEVSGVQLTFNEKRILAIVHKHFPELDETEDR